MDFTVLKSKCRAWIRKYRYVAIVLGVGIVLMLWPSEPKNEESVDQIVKVGNHDQLEITTDILEDILSQIKGVGKVDVLLTYSAGERTIYHANERASSTENSQSKDTETVLITNGNRNEEALVSQVLAPEFLGAVIVCQGAEDPSVRLAISDAVSKATGLGSDRISVVSMK